MLIYSLSALNVDFLLCNKVVCNIFAVGDSQEVSLFLFMEHVASKIVSKWRRVGIALKLDMSLLDAIEDQRRGRAFDCFSEVYKYWQQQSSPERPVNWASIVAALRSQSVGEERLADVIEATFMN